MLHMSRIYCWLTLFKGKTRDALSYLARRYDSVICCSKMSKNEHVSAANTCSWIVPSCSVIT